MVVLLKTMSKLSRHDALEDIANWSANDVETLLRKNGLEEECCLAVAKRKIGGDELLHLTEGKLALWKSDLTRPLIWSLWTFVEELRKCPEKYVEEKRQQTENELEDTVSDTDSWATDFEDEIEESVDEKVEAKPVEMRAVAVSRCTEFRNSLKVFQENDKAAIKQQENKTMNMNNRLNNKTLDDNTYANYEMEPGTEMTYANCEVTEVEVTKLQKNESKLHSTGKKSLAEQLREQLMLRDAQKPALAPKPEIISTNRENSRKTPQTSFLHTKTSQKENGGNGVQKRMFVPPPAEPKKVPAVSQTSDSVNKNLPKPPGLIRSFDLVANLPTRTEESEDEYEAFDEQIIEQHQRRESMARADSKQSLTSGHQSSIESVYQPPSITSHEEEEEYEIYESITETPDENETERRSTSLAKQKILENPPPLPAKLPNSKLETNTGIQKKDAGLGHFTEIEFKPVSFQYYGAGPDLQGSVKNSLERSLDKKFATLPHSGSNTSLSSEIATRPLPPPPDKQSYMDKPWFHNVTREQAMILIREQSTYGNNPQDGYFLMRPSTSNPNNPLTLVLWYRDRVYNVPVRKRTDNRFALGSAKANEQSFASIEEIVPFYTKEELFLYTGGILMGSTKLLDTPPK